MNKDKRDPFGVKLAILFVLMAGAFSVAAINVSGWFWVPAFGVGFLGLVGLAEELSKSK